MNLVAYNNQNFKDFNQASIQGGVYTLRTLTNNYSSVDIGKLLHIDKYVNETTNLIQIAENMADMIEHNSATNYTFVIADGNKALFETQPNGVWQPYKDLYDIECDKSKQILKDAKIKAYIESPKTIRDTEVVVYIEEFGRIHKLVMDNDVQVSCPSAIKIGIEDFECRLYLNTDDTDSKFYGLQIDFYNSITDESDGNLITNYDFDEFIMCDIKPQIELEYLKQVISNEVSNIENYKGEGYVEGDDIDLAVKAIKEVII